MDPQIEAANQAAREAAQFPWVVFIVLGFISLLGLISKIKNSSNDKK